MSVLNPEQTPVQDPAQGTVDPTVTILSSIKNEQGEQKYKDVNTALEALQHSQAYIPELKSQLETSQSELAQMRLEMAKLEGVKSTLERFQSNPASQEPVHQTPVQEPAENIEALVSRQFETYTQQQQYAANLQDVDNALSNFYGDRAQEIAAQKALELGMSGEALENMAKTSPKAVLALMGVDASKTHSTSSVSAGSVRTETLTPRVEPLSAPEHSLLIGATAKQQGDFMAQIRAEVYKEYGVDA